MGILNVVEWVKPDMTDRHALCVVLCGCVPHKQINMIPLQCTFKLFLLVSPILVHCELYTSNQELKNMYALKAEIKWKVLTTGKSHYDAEAAQFAKLMTIWRRNKCQTLSTVRKSSLLSQRATHILCNGPIYTPLEAKRICMILAELRAIYEKGRVCFKSECVRIEPDLNVLMGSIRDPHLLKTVWTEWREVVGPPSKPLYAQLVNLMNVAARRAGYNNVGEWWREELEIENVEQEVEKVYKELLPMYKQLHGVVRFRLRQHYGSNHVKTHAPIPAHLLGDMWAQNWGAIFDVVYRSTSKSKEMMSDVKDMVKAAEENYVSLGFPRMTHQFWTNSRFEHSNGTCHGMAANMFREQDYRMLVCGSAMAQENYHLIHHEMGHIHYFMAYTKQPAIFQDGANSAIQEAIGEAVMMIVNFNKQEASKDQDIILLLKLALRLLPQMAFALVMDKWRWSVFNGSTPTHEYNAAWWAITTQYQGIDSPLPRHQIHFDAAAKFHIGDNTPYIRYFLASVLQVQIFEAMCKGAIYQNSHSKQEVPYPMHRCNVTSNSSSGTLRNMMSKGRSIKWAEAVGLVTGRPFSTNSFLNIFQPLRLWLNHLIEMEKIPIGW